MTAPSVAAPTFALVRAPIAPMLAEPHVAAGQVSQTLFGHAPAVVDTQGDWHRLRTLDGYEGWTHAGYLAVLDEPLAPALDPAAIPSTNGSPLADFDPARLADLLGGEAVPQVSLGCTVRAGQRRLHLPLGAWVHAPQTRLAGELVGLDELPERFPRDADAIARTAARWFEGTGYQWGGVTPWGADCSGLVQTVFGLHGVALPRDAWQQSRVGTDAGTDPSALAPGDLLFFSDRDDRHVTHVALSLGGARLMHQALGRGGWSVDDLADEADPYTRRLRGRFLFGRRVL